MISLKFMGLYLLFALCIPSLSISLLIYYNKINKNKDIWKPISVIMMMLYIIIYIYFALYAGNIWHSNIFINYSEVGKEYISFDRAVDRVIQAVFLLFLQFWIFKNE